MCRAAPPSPSHAAGPTTWTSQPAAERSLRRRLASGRSAGPLLPQTPRGNREGRKTDRSCWRRSSPFVCVFCLAGHARVREPRHGAAAAVVATARVQISKVLSAVRELSWCSRVRQRLPERCASDAVSFLSARCRKGR